MVVSGMPLVCVMPRLHLESYTEGSECDCRNKMPCVNTVFGEGSVACPVLWLVIPCYNEEEVFPITAPIFRKVVNDLMDDGLVSPESKILFVDDGPIDKTWDIISDLADQASVYSGIPLSRNRGHQNALLAVCLVKRSSTVSAS